MNEWYPCSRVLDAAFWMLKWWMNEFLHWYLLISFSNCCHPCLCLFAHSCSCHLCFRGLLFVYSVHSLSVSQGASAVSLGPLSWPTLLTHSLGSLCAAASSLWCRVPLRSQQIFYILSQWETQDVIQETPWCEITYSIWRTEVSEMMEFWVYESATDFGRTGEVVGGLTNKMAFQTEMQQRNDRCCLCVCVHVCEYECRSLCKCVCMWICMWVCAHVCVSLSVYEYLCAWLCVCVSAWVLVYMWMCVHVAVHVFGHMCEYACEFVHCVYVCMCMYM